MCDVHLSEQEWLDNHNGGDSMMDSYIDGLMDCWIDRLINGLLLYMLD